MRWVKLTFLLVLWGVCFFAAVLIHLAAAALGPSRRWRAISRLTRIFASLLCSILSIRITIEGEQDRLEAGGSLILSNHLGYIDGVVLGSIFPVIYVSKKEVRGLPVIGQWIALCGTIFVDRKAKDKILLLVEAITGKLRQGANVLVFPEGTSTNGETLLPFQSAFFAAPLRARCTLVPVTLTYERVNHRPLSKDNRDLIYWYGDMEFVSHFWSLLALRSIEVLVHIHPEIETAPYKNTSLSRKQLSQACYNVIAGDVAFGGIQGQVRVAPRHRPSGMAEL